MAIQKYTVGPGSLTLGAYSDSAHCQVKSLKVTASEKVKTTDPQAMLCGEDLTTPDVVTLEWKLTGKLLQDLRTAGLIAYTWTNAGAEVAFTYVPNTTLDRKVSGTVRVVPLSVGGDAGTQPDDDISWTIIGTPALGDATP